MVNFLTSGNKMSKVIRSMEEEAPKVENGLARTAKEAEVAGELASKKSGSLGERAYDTIDVDARNVPNESTDLMTKLDGADTSKMKPSEDAFALGAGSPPEKPPIGGVDVSAGDVPFDGKGNKSKALMGAAALGGTGVVAGSVYMLGKDGTTAFPSKTGIDDPRNVKPSTAPAVPSMEPAPTTNLPSAEKYADAYNKLKLPDQSKEYAAMQGDLAKDINTANDLYGQTKDKVAAQEMWDGIIKGIGHIAAGVYGQNTGLDLSGVKFDKEDWDKKRELAQNELRDSIQNARMKNAITKEQIDRSYARSKDQLDVDKSQIEAAEKRDVNAATLRESGAKRKDEMKIKMAELSIQARQLGDKDKVKQLADFKDMENKLDVLMTKYTEKPSQDLKSMVAAQTQQYESTGKALGFGPKDLQYTMSDINSSAVPQNIHNARMQRIGAASTPQPTAPPPTGLIQIKGPDGSIKMWDPSKKQLIH